MLSTTITFIEPVRFRERLGGVDDGLVVRAVVARSGRGDADAHLAVTVRVEVDGLARGSRVGGGAVSSCVSGAQSAVAASVVTDSVLAGSLAGVELSLDVSSSLPHAATTSVRAASATNDLRAPCLM